MRFNQKFKYNQTFGKRSWNDNTDKKVETFTNHIRQYKDKIRFKSVAFDQIEISSDKIMFYADPPYGRVKNGDGSIGKKQISEAGYNAFWKEDDDIKLYNYLKSIDEKGSSFMVSGVLNHDGKTCWMLDKLIQDGCRSKELQFDYNKVSRKGDKVTTEVIIMNY
jgi:site-specific DNA-adenine methylase